MYTIRPQIGPMLEINRAKEKSKSERYKKVSSRKMKRHGGISDTGPFRPQIVAISRKQGISQVFKLHEVNFDTSLS